MKKTLFLSLAVLLVLTGWGCGKKNNEGKTNTAATSPSAIVVPVNTHNPAVEKYKDYPTCEGLEDFKDCYANQAVSKNDPTLCQKLEPGLDMLCYQYFYIQRNDPKSCNILPSKAYQATCNDYYRELEKNKN